MMNLKWLLRRFKTKAKYKMEDSKGTQHEYQILVCL